MKCGLECLIDDKSTLVQVMACYNQAIYPYILRLRADDGAAKISEADRHHNDITQASGNLKNADPYIDCLFVSLFWLTTDKEYIKAPQYWPFLICSHWWIPLTKGQYCRKRFSVVTSSRDIWVRDRAIALVYWPWWNGAGSCLCCTVTGAINSELPRGNPDLDLGLEWPHSIRDNDLNW